MTKLRSLGTLFLFLFVTSPVLASAPAWTDSDDDRSTATVRAAPLAAAEMAALGAASLTSPELATARGAALQEDDFWAENWEIITFLVLLTAFLVIFAT